MNLISKKDLLAITGISYGQLYRWKRERLIPEEWFIKQSSYTGQETFFPREQILSRIRSIQELKDKYSLEELAKILSPETSPAKYTIYDLKELEEIDQKLLTRLEEDTGRNQFDFLDIIFFAALSTAAKEIGMSEEQCRELIRKCIALVSEQKSVQMICTIFRLDEEYHAAFSSGTAPVFFDQEIEVAAQLSLSEIADRIKTRYKNRFI